MPTTLTRRAPQFMNRSADNPEIEATIEDFKAFAGKTQEELVNTQYAIIAAMRCSVNAASDADTASTMLGPKRGVRT